MLLSNACISKGLTSFNEAFLYIKQLPYGRTSNRSDYALVIKEGKGTCSTKHAFLKALAIENKIDDLELCLGIFQMNAKNTPKIKSILEQYDLSYIPEAHCYLKGDDNIIDITFPNESQPIFKETLVFEETILPKQIGDYKIELHQNYLKSWIEKDNIALSFEDLWTIRETCIQTISA